MIRRGWEQGQTGASLAQQFDIGLANLWRRRASEGWRRKPPEDRVPEPLEGWTRHVDTRVSEFEDQLARERMIAERLAGALTGGGAGDVPLWHLGFLARWRAEHLGPEAARADRERFVDQDWAVCVWDEDGAIRPQDACDRALMKAHRQDLLDELGLPEAARRWLP